MKSLLNSGDTEKIIFFAGTARQCHSQLTLGQRPVKTERTPQAAFACSSLSEARHLRLGRVRPDQMFAINKRGNIHFMASDLNLNPQELLAEPGLWGPEVLS